MLLFAAEPSREDEPPEGHSAPGRRDVPEGEETRPEQPASTPPPLPERPTPAADLYPDLPSYPREAGRSRQHRSGYQHRPPPAEDEYGLPTYPRTRRPQKRRSVLDKVLVLVLSLAAVLLIGYLVAQIDRTPPPDSLLGQAIDAAGRTQVALETDSPDRVRQFVRDEFGWNVGVPVFADADLRGVGIAALAPAIEVPAFFYGDQRGRQSIVYSLSYALLDQVPDRVRLSRADYERLADDPSPRIHRIARQDVALWRDRADIFVLVSDGSPAEILQTVRVTR